MDLAVKMQVLWRMLFIYEFVSSEKMKDTRFHPTYLFQKAEFRCA